MVILAIFQTLSLAPNHLLLLLYSITDRTSFLTVSTMLGNMDMLDTRQMMLLGNKLDLDHLREVSIQVIFRETNKTHESGFA